MFLVACAVFILFCGSFKTQVKIKPRLLSDWQT